MTFFIYSDCEDVKSYHLSNKTHCPKVVFNDLSHDFEKERDALREELVNKKEG